MTSPIIRYLLLALNGLSVGLNVSTAIINYNNEMSSFGWWWNGLAALLSTGVLVWILFWEKK